MTIPREITDPAELAAAACIAEAACLSATLEAWWATVTAELEAAWGADEVRLVHLGSAGLVGDRRSHGGSAAPEELGPKALAREAVALAREAVDRDRPMTQGAWSVAPLGRGREVALAVRLAPVAGQGRGAVGSTAGILLERLVAWASWLDELQEAVTARVGSNVARTQAEAVLALVKQWHGLDDLEKLLVAIAEAARRLLAADRATIFLWDRQSHTLVGRPALGVAGGELRVGDDRGVVGQVFATGEPRRVDRGLHQEWIDRQVDQRLGYRTVTLLCVPLLGARGQRLGAFQVLNKRQGDFTADDTAMLTELAAHAALAVDKVQDRQRLLRTQRQLADQAAGEIVLIGESPAIAALRAMVERVAATDLTVLVTGGNGTGKEVVSRLLHRHGGRKLEPFLPVNCASLSETLLESELFGHERGAFTDAHAERAGKFELAGRGTLFLDEIGELSRGAQAKLLRVVEERKVVRVGGSTPLDVEARLIVATNRDLPRMVAEGTFREDLFYRLSVVTIELPPLRARCQDILPLARHFLERYCAQAGREPPRLAEEAVARLEAHRWPGNVRELRNLMERIAFLHKGDEVSGAEVAFAGVAKASEPAATRGRTWSLAEATHEFQRQHVEAVLAASAGNLGEAAERLGVHRANLYRKLRQLGLMPPGGK